MTDTVRDVADRAAEAVRTLNHLTRNGGLNDDLGLAEPGDVYDLVGSLTLIAERLPQLLGQMGAYLIREANAGRIYHDQAEPERPAVDRALGALTEASAVADKLAAALRSAHSAASHLAAT